MVKFNIEIKETRNDSLIIKAEVKNGNWKYWDNIQETDNMESITINTIGKSYYLLKPVVDYVEDYDTDIYNKTGEFVEIGKLYRQYDSLLEYLNCRIENARDSYFKEHDYNCQLKDCYNRLSELNEESELIYKNDMDLVVNIVRED